MAIKILYIDHSHLTSKILWRIKRNCTLNGVTSRRQLNKNWKLPALHPSEDFWAQKSYLHAPKGKELRLCAMKNNANYVHLIHIYHGLTSKTGNSSFLCKCFFISLTIFLSSMRSENRPAKYVTCSTHVKTFQWRYINFVQK